MLLQDLIFKTRETLHALRRALVLTNAPLHIGDTLCASHTSAWILAAMPIHMLMNPISRWNVDSTSTATTTPNMVFNPLPCLLLHNCPVTAVVCGHRPHYSSDSALLNSPSTSFARILSPVLHNIYDILSRGRQQQNQLDTYTSPLVLQTSSHKACPECHLLSEPAHRVELAMLVTSSRVDVART